MEHVLNAKRLFVIGGYFGSSGAPNYVMCLRFLDNGFGTTFTSDGHLLLKNSKINELEKGLFRKTKKKNILHDSSLGYFHYSIWSREFCN